MVAEVPAGRAGSPSAGAPGGAGAAILVADREYSPAVAMVAARPRLPRAPRSNRHPVVDGPERRRLFAWLRAASGVDFEVYRPAMVARRIEHRMRISRA